MTDSVSEALSRLDFGFFVEPEFVVVYVSFLLLVFAIASSKFLLGSRKVRQGLRGALSVISRVNNPITFHGRFAQIDERLQRNPIVGEAWREFVECLVFPDDPNSEISNSRDPGEYLHTDSVIDRTISIRSYNSVPNVLTGLGILGTFIGLAAGIHVAQGGLAAPSIGEMQESLGGLLSGASLAFITSVAGLFLSLLFLTFERLSLGRRQKELQDFVGRIDSLVTRTTAERILRDQLRELKVHSTQLTSFNTDLAFSIAEALDDKLTRRLTPALDRLVDIVEDLRDQERSSSEEAIRQLAGEFRESVTAGTTQEFHAIGETLQRLDASLSRSADQLQAQEDSLRRTVNDVIGAMGAAFENSSAQLHGEVNGGIQEMLEAVAASVSSLQEGLSQGQAGMNRVLTEAASRMENQAETDLAKRAERFEQLTSQLTDQLAQAGSKMAGTITDSTASLGSQLAGLDSHVASLSELLAGSERAASEMTAATDGVARIIRDFDGLRQTLERASADMAAGGRSSETAASAVSSSVGQLEHAVARLMTSHESASAAWAAYRDRFDGVDEAVQGMFEKIDVGLAAYTDRVRDFNQNIDGNMTRAVETLRGMVQELSETVEELHQSAA